MAPGARKPSSTSITADVRPPMRRAILATKFERRLVSNYGLVAKGHQAAQIA